MNLRNMTPEIDMTDCKITIPEINRPALQLTGYFEHFAKDVYKRQDQTRG